MNCTPFVRQYIILSNKWGAVHCMVDYVTVKDEVDKAMSNRAGVVLLSYALQTLPYAVMRQGGYVH